MTTSSRISHRKIWMFPRNKRRTRPLDVALTLRALIVASNRGTTWSGKQEQQNEFAKLLDEFELKDGGSLRDKNSGGSRTYAAQFRSLGLIYDDKTSLMLTQAGEDMVNLSNPTGTLQFQVLKFQYPSEYSLSSNVKIHPSIKVRPFLLLLKLASDADLQGLSDTDVMVAVVHGRSDASFQLCKTRIQKARADGIDKVIPNNDDIRTPRTRNNSYDQRLSDIKDVANTFKNVLQGVDLIELRFVQGEKRFFPRPGVMSLADDVKSVPYVDWINTHAMQAMLKFGNRKGSVKDTRRVFMPNTNPELSTKESLIAKRFLDTTSFPVTDSEIQSFSQKMQNEFGLSYAQIRNALEPFLQNISQYTGARLLSLSSGGLSTAIAFERAIARVFELEFGYETEWTGPRKRPAGLVGGYADVHVIECGRNFCGIIDAKSTKEYSLPHNDYAKMLKTYIPAVHEIYGKRPGGYRLSFIAFISHMITPGATTKARRLFEESGVPIALCSAYGLNNMREDPSFRRCPERVTSHLSSGPVVQIQ